MTGRGPVGFTEKDLMQGLIDAARHTGWLVYHTHDSRRSGAGFPDLVLVHPARRELAFIECKAEKGRTSEAQKAWLAALEDFASAVATDLVGRGGFHVGIANPDTYDSWLAYIMGSKA